MRCRATLWTVVGLSAIGLPGCGSNDSSEPEGASSPSSEAASTPQDPKEVSTAESASGGKAEEVESEATYTSPPAPTSPKSAEDETDESKPTGDASAAAKPSGKIELVPVTVEEFRERVTALKGKVVAIDLWATW